MLLWKDNRFIFDCSFWTRNKLKSYLSCSPCIAWLSTLYCCFTIAPSILPYSRLHFASKHLSSQKGQLDQINLLLLSSDFRCSYHLLSFESRPIPILSSLPNDAMTSKVPAWHQSWRLNGTAMQQNHFLFSKLLCANIAVPLVVSQSATLWSREL